MSTDEPFAPPCKKLNIFWWIGGFFLALVLLFLLQLFGPNPRIVVSPQTTHIVAPLGPNGLPDYEQHIVNLSRDGVTPENNAAVLLWQALFPAEVEPQHFAAIAKELGLAEIPAEEDALERLHSQANRDRLAALLKERAGLKDDGQVMIAGYDQESVWFDRNSPLIEDVLTQVMSRPWTSEQLPAMADWVRNNEKALELMVAASHRPRYYAPSPNLIDNQRNLLIEMLLPLAQSMRESGRALSARAMWHLGEDRADEAWRDVIAMHHLSHLFTQGHTLVEQLIAMATSNMACDATATLLDRGRLTADQARQVQRDLAAVPNFAVVARSLDTVERLSALDAFLQVGTGGGGELFSALGGGSPGDFGTNAFDVISVDWNFVLRETNRWYDRIAAAAKMEDWASRSAAMEQMDADLMQMASNSRSPTTFASSVISRQGRSEHVASILLSMFLPAIHAATHAEDRANATLELTRLAAALAIYRAENGAYPEKLDGLVPGVLEALPVDLYNAKAYVYKRDGEGYLLYSLGENGTDDGGSNERQKLLNGRSAEQRDATEFDTAATIPSGADDLPIRVPTPTFELPKLTLPEQQ